MAGYVVRRVAQGLVTLWVVWSLVFVLYFIVPEDPAKELVGRAATPAMIQRITDSLGLQRPLWQQYLAYFDRIFHLNLGYSFTSNAPVWNIVAHAVPVDVSLAVPAALIWLSVGLSIGVMAARHPGSLRARVATILVLGGMSIPSFLLGTLLVYVFTGLLTHALNVFPPPGESWTPFTSNPIEWAHGLVLPWLTLGFASAATYVRLTRSAFRDVLSEDYITAARARGVPERRLILRHALRVAVTPLLTQFGIDFAAVIAGAIVTEVIFGLPGLGRTLIGAVDSQDLPVVQGVVLLLSTVVVVANLVVDILYGVIDRRVRLYR